MPFMNNINGLNGLSKWKLKALHYSIIPRNERYFWKIGYFKRWSYFDQMSKFYNHNSSSKSYLDTISNSKTIQLLLLWFSFQIEWLTLYPLKTIYTNQIILFINFPFIFFSHVISTLNILMQQLNLEKC